ncbi:MAG: hypothetical protein ACOYBR_09640 [Fluviibacter sp.]
MRRSDNFTAAGPSDLPLYLTHADIASVLRVTERYVKERVIHHPTFPDPREATGVPLYPRVEFLRWLESHRRTDGPAPRAKPAPTPPPAKRKKARGK